MLLFLFLKNCFVSKGFTMYAQRRISEKLFGRAVMCLEATVRRELLRQHMENTGMVQSLLFNLRLLAKSGH